MQNYFFPQQNRRAQRQGILPVAPPPPTNVPPPPIDVALPGMVMERDRKMNANKNFDKRQDEPTNNPTVPPGQAPSLNGQQSDLAAKLRELLGFKPGQQGQPAQPGQTLGSSVMQGMGFSKGTLGSNIFKLLGF